MIALDSIDSASSSIAIKSSGGTELAIDGSGFITSNINGTVTIPGLISDVDYDYYTRVLSGADNEIETWTYRNGGSGGTVVAVVVATYTDSYRDDLITVDRTT